MSQQIAMMALGGCVFIGTMAYKRWITINFRTITRDAMGVLFGRPGTPVGDRLKNFFCNTLPLVGSFAFGAFVTACGFEALPQIQAFDVIEE